HLLRCIAFGCGGPKESFAGGSCETSDAGRLVVEGGQPDSLKRGQLTLISANWPAIHYSRFANSAAGCQHFGDMQVTAESHEIVRALQIALPPAKSCVVAE